MLINIYYINLYLNFSIIAISKIENSKPSFNYYFIILEHDEHKNSPIRSIFYVNH